LNGPTQQLQQLQQQLQQQQLNGPTQQLQQLQQQLQQQQQANPTPSQMLYDQIMNGQGRPPPMGSAALQRSRSLGRDSTPTHLPNVGGSRVGPAGSRTPTSVARKVLESVTKRKNKDKSRGGRPPIDPRHKGLLGPGPGQLVQTPDGRLVALGPGNSFYEVGTVAPAAAMMDPRLAHFVNVQQQQQDPRLNAFGGMMDPRLARQISQDREQMLYGGEPRQELEERLAYNARLHGMVGTPPTGRAAGPPPLRDRRFGELSGEEKSYYDQFQQGGYQDQISPREELERIAGTQQAARLAGNLSSPPWRGIRGPSDGDSPRKPPPDDDDSDLQSSTDTNQQLMQYSSPSAGLLGKDITPDSGVVTESRNHSKEREQHDARLRRQNYASNNNNPQRSSRNCAEQLEHLGEQLSRSSCGDQLSQLGEQLDQLGEQLGQLQKEQEAQQLSKQIKKRPSHQDGGSCSSSDESSCEGEVQSGGGRKSHQYKALPQTDPAITTTTTTTTNDKKINGDNKDKRERKSSVQSNVSDSDPISYEFSADSLLSDSDKESPEGNQSEQPVSQKLTNVCNEIKARFLPE